MRLIAMIAALAALTAPALAQDYSNYSEDALRAELARIAECHVLAYPNAGLPNAFGEYDETPDETAAFIADWAQSGLINIAGGCCGTTPAHIAAIARDARAGAPRKRDDRPRAMRLSGLEPFELA